MPTIMRKRDNSNPRNTQSPEEDSFNKKKQKQKKTKNKKRTYYAKTSFINFVHSGYSHSEDYKQNLVFKLKNFVKPNKGKTN